MIVYVNYKRLKGIATKFIADLKDWYPLCYNEPRRVEQYRVYIKLEDVNDQSKYHELLIDVYSWYQVGNILFLETVNFNILP